MEKILAQMFATEAVNIVMYNKIVELGECAYRKELVEFVDEVVGFAIEKDLFRSKVGRECNEHCNSVIQNQWKRWGLVISEKGSGIYELVENHREIMLGHIELDKLDNLTEDLIRFKRRLDKKDSLDSNSNQIPKKNKTNEVIDLFENVEESYHQIKKKNDSVNIDSKITKSKDEIKEEVFEIVSILENRIDELEKDNKDLKERVSFLEGEDKDPKIEKNYRKWKSNLYQLQKGHCNGCDAFLQPQHLVVDHIDGSRNNNLAENLQLLCNHCNSIKGKKDMTFLRNRIKELRKDPDALYV